MMEVTRDIRCKGCGETGQAVWAVTQWHSEALDQRTPLRVSGRFSIGAHGKGMAIARGRCQQIHNHG